MKIALIQPNSPFLTDERVFPNIGLVRVGTQLEYEGHDIKIYDFNNKNDKEISSTMKKIANDYDYYNFSSTTPQFLYTKKIFDYLKEENPNAKTIIGGPHASALYQLKQRGIKDINVNDLEIFDTIYAGEGEETSNMFKSGWQKGKLIKHIDDVLVPNRNLIDLNSYNYTLFNKDTTSIQTQRGCPHQCVFCCGRDIEMYNKVRTHSPKRVLEELDDLQLNYGYESFMWYDDEINLSNKRLEELCIDLSTRPYQHRGFIRNDNIVKNPESVKYMKNAGFVKLAAGIESGSDRILNILNKKSDYKTNLKARQIVGDAGVHYEGFMIIGHPSETLDDIKLTRKWLLEAKPDDFDLNLLTPYPGSKIYNDSIPSTKFKDYGWEWKGLYFNKPRYQEEESYYKGLNKQSKSDIRTKTLSNEDLTNIRNDLEAEVRAK